MSNLREISVAECKAVFGGNSDNEEPIITVSGSKLYYESTLIWDFQQDIGFGSGVFGPAGNGGFGNLTLPEGWDLGWVDTDNDGVPDSPPIVVTASVTNEQIQFLNQAAAWYQWGQNAAFNLFVGGSLMTSSLTEGGQLAAGAAITGAASVPPLSDAQYQANWNILYYSMQVWANNPNQGLNPGLNMY